MMETSAGDLRRNLIDQPQTVSQAFNLGSKTAIQNVIDELDLQAAKRVQSGFNEVTFTLGVLNCFLILFIFGNFPQHFWLLYIIESAFFIPTRFMQMSRAIPNQAFYYFDLCWIMNFCGVAALLIMMFGRNLLSEHFIRILLFASFGIACGPLLGANIALSFVALIFHDVSSMTSVFIHIYPPVLMYVMRWKSEAVTDAWPNKFELNYDVNFFSLGRRLLRGFCVWCHYDCLLRVVRCVYHLAAVGGVEPSEEWRKVRYGLSFNHAWWTMYSDGEDFMEEAGGA